MMKEGLTKIDWISLRVDFTAKWNRPLVIQGVHVWFKSHCLSSACACYAQSPYMQGKIYCDLLLPLNVSHLFVNVNQFTSQKSLLINLCELGGNLTSSFSFLINQFYSEGSGQFVVNVLQWNYSVTICNVCSKLVLFEDNFYCVSTAFPGGFYDKSKVHVFSFIFRSSARNNLMPAWSCVCLSVCVCVCLSVCLSVSPSTFWYTLFYRFISF